MRLALYQPDIPPNLGAAIRTCACLGAPLDIIEPCGFPLTDKALARASLDYEALAAVTRHASFADFLSAPERRIGRLVLVETVGAVRLDSFGFLPGDTLILGRETVGAGADLLAAAQAIVRIPMTQGARSLNVAIAGAIALAEALRQTDGFRDLT